MKSKKVIIDISINTWDIIKGITLLLFFLGILYLGYKVDSYLIGELTDNLVNEKYYKQILVISWIVAFIFTGGIILTFSMIISAIMASILFKIK